MLRRRFIKLAGGSILSFLSFGFLKADPQRPNDQSANWPSAMTTGVPAGTTLAIYDGDLRTASDNQVIDALDVRGDIHVLHADVTIKRSRAYHILADIQTNRRSTPSRLTIQDCELNGQNQNTATGCIQIVGSNNDGVLPTLSPADGANIRRCNIWNCENGIWLEANNILVEDCYLHDHHNDSNRDPHIDGIQIPSCSDGTRVTNISICHCNFDMLPHSTSSCITFKDADDILIEACRLKNGAHLVDCVGTYRNIVIRYCNFIPEPMGYLKSWFTISKDGSGTVTAIGNYFGT